MKIVNMRRCLNQLEQAMSRPATPEELHRLQLHERIKAGRMRCGMPAREPNNNEATEKMRKGLDLAGMLKFLRKKGE